MKSSLWIAMVMMAVAFSACAERETATNPEAEAVKTVVRDAYVYGIQIDRNVEAIRKGFDPVFNILILQNDEISEYPIETWIEGIEASLETNPGPREYETTYEFPMVDVTGSAAVVQVELYRDEVHFFTDYLSLYKFSDGWKIVSKIFYRHPESM
ncbi:nuclear transport factor 2 family protein [Candidatus Neomarinimicrobiota bacterium]